MADRSAPRRSTGWEEWRERCRPFRAYRIRSVVHRTKGGALGLRGHGQIMAPPLYLVSGRRERDRTLHSGVVPRHADHRSRAHTPRRRCNIRCRRGQSAAAEAVPCGESWTPQRHFAAALNGNSVAERAIRKFGRRSDGGDPNGCLPVTNAVADPSAPPEQLVA
jgi:hypothetical protein